jgi:DNA-binding MarR family transcriptional regulator
MGKLEEIISKLSAYMAHMEELAREQYQFKDLTLTQMHYLEMISELENPNLTELAAAMKLTKPTITVLVDKLIEKELAYKVKSDADRRSTHLHLTEKGKLINQMHEYAHLRMAREIEEKITPEEKGELTRLLDKILK